MAAGKCQNENSNTAGLSDVKALLLLLVNKEITAQVRNFWTSAGTKS